MIWTFLIVGVLSGGLFFLLNWLMGYRKGHMQIDFEERYSHHQAYVKAIKNELKGKGYEVTYEGDYKFIIDGKPFVFIERNVSMGGVPLQRTILKPVNR